MSLERLNAIESELGIKKEQPSLPQQSSIPTSIDTTISPSKPKSRLDEIEQELFQTKVTDSIPLTKTPHLKIILLMTWTPLVLQRLTINMHMLLS